jgi:hypothetical protein
MSRRSLFLGWLLFSSLPSSSAPPGKSAEANGTDASSPSAAQPPQIVRNWNFSLKKDGREQGRFRGETALVVGPNQFEVSTLQVHTFRLDGEPDLSATSPNCRVAVTTNGFLITSSSRLELNQADGRFGLTGEGFRWDHGNQRLTVSNRVESFLVLSLPRPSANP